MGVAIVDEETPMVAGLELYFGLSSRWDLVNRRAMYVPLRNKMMSNDDVVLWCCNIRHIHLAMESRMSPSLES